MFGLFKRQAVIELPKTQTHGFFSTGESFNFKGRVKPLSNEIYQAILARTFQRTAKDLAEVDTTGNILTTRSDASMAMDEAYTDLQSAKIQNSGFGFIPWQQYTWYAGQGFIGYQACAMLVQQWLVNKVVSMPALDATRHGYEVTVNDGTEVSPDVMDEIRHKDKEFRIPLRCVDQIKSGRTFGIRIALFRVNSTDPLYYEKPFNIDGVAPGSYKGISQIDPYWITPLLDQDSATNPASEHFYEPTWWFVNGRKYHRTHLVIMRNGGELPDILKPTYFYGGIPTTQQIADRVYAAERTANEAPMLAMTKRLTVLNLDITKVLANKDAFNQHMADWTELMNNYGVKIVGEDEEIKQFDTSLADLDAVIMTQYQLVAAAGGVPSTKVLGTSPKGFGASGEYEESSYHELLETMQEHYLTPLVDRHHLLLIKSYISPKFGIEPFRTEIVWKPTDTPTAKEQAEINLIDAQTDNALVQTGGIDGTDVRKRIVNDPESGYNGFEEVVPDGPGDREAQQEAEAALEQPVQQNNKGKSGGQDAMDDEDDHFDPLLGTFNGAMLITSQKFIDEDKVQEKIRDGDFKVNITPEFYSNGEKYRMIIDGHHSLAAAMRSKISPVFVQSVPHQEVINAVTKESVNA